MADTLFHLSLPDLTKRLAEIDQLSWAQIEEIAKTGYQEIELIMTEAKEITPVDLGNLKNSGHVQMPVKTNTAVSLEFGFGGPAGCGNMGGETNDLKVGYAVIVHEDLEAHHTPGLTAKYLEIPVTRHTGDLDRALIRALDNAAQRTISK